MLFSIYILISAAHTHTHIYISVCGPEGELTAPSTRTFDNTLLQKEIFSPVAAELTSGILIPPDNLLFVYIMWLLSCYFFLFFSFLFFFVLPVLQYVAVFSFFMEEAENLSRVWSETNRGTP